MMRATPPQHSRNATVQENMMHRIILPTQGGSALSGSGRPERSREDMPYTGRNFAPPAYQSQKLQQVSGEMMDMWPNAGTDNFSSNLNGSGYGYGPSAGASMYPDVLNLPQLPLYLRCPDCGICKGSSEDMEVHIKMEHLQWYPFQCTMCNAERAADFQLREHIHSAHRKSIDKFIYVDNPPAKHAYLGMMIRSLLSARRAPPMVNNSQSSPAAPRFRAPPPPPLVSSMRERLVNHACDLKLQDGRSTTNALSAHEPVIENPLRNISSLAREKGSVTLQQQLTKPTLSTTTAGATATVIPASPISDIARKRPASDDNPVFWNTNTDAVLSAIRVATHENGEKEGAVEENGVDNGEDEEETAFSGRRNVKSAFDVGMDEPVPEQSDEGALATGVDGNQDTTEILGNVAAIFSADDIDLARKRRKIAGNSEHARMSASSVPYSLAKKRVLGECSRCKKPVTAGARQMHMFYHLGKDCQIYRFHCKYPGCGEKHYRKDQMENHQSKVHGKINPMLIEDRTAELYNTTTQLSMKLLGTAGNIPGPTAARAQIRYEELLAAQANNPKRKKRAAERALAAAAAAVRAGRIAAMQEANRMERSMSFPTSSMVHPPPEQSDEQKVQCRKCRLGFSSKARGYHILWHMSNDLGLHRYVCRFCDFGRDRTQAVINHGKEEHDMEDCVEDRIEDYSDEVKAMSEQCFGLQSSFMQEGQKNNKPTDEAGVRGEGSIGDTKVNISNEIMNTSYTTHDRIVNASSASDVSESSHSVIQSKSELQPQSSSGTSYRDRMRKQRNRRFGMRKPPSKSKRKEMARLRAISMLLGGAQYIKKRLSEAAHCSICGILTTSRLTDHAYKHLDVQLFVCPKCDLGNQSRDTVVKHIRDVHNSREPPNDNRWTYRAEVKEIMRRCYGPYYVDAPIPTHADIEKLMKSLANESHLDARVLGTFDDEQPENDGAQQEPEDTGEADEGDSDDERQEEGGSVRSPEDHSDTEQETQPSVEGSRDALDDNVLCEADEAQGGFEMERNDEEFANDDANDDVEENGEDGEHEDQESSDGTPEQSVNNEVPEEEEEDLAENDRNLVQKGSAGFDLSEGMVEESGNMKAEEEEELEAEM